MTDKHIDLFTEIARMVMPQDERVGISTALRWLDDHPEACPGRTITESELESAIRGISSNDAQVAGRLEYMNRALHLLGITVVPDPEPTNAEKLNSLYGEWADDPSPTKLALGEWLELRGVKAPGGDE